MRRARTLPPLEDHLEPSSASTERPGRLDRARARPRVGLVALLALAAGGCTQTHLVPIGADGGVDGGADAGAEGDAGSACRPGTGDEPWAFTGGPAAAIDALVYDGRTFVAVARGAVYRATSMSGPWQEAPSAGNLGIPPSIVSAGLERGFVAVGPSGPIRSVDGATWTSAVAGLEDAVFVRVSASAAGPLALGAGSVFTLDDERWSLAFDTGEHDLLEVHPAEGGWIGLTTGLSVVRFTAEGVERSPLATVVDLHAHAGALYALDSAGGVQRSDDGLRWEELGRPSGALGRGLVTTDDGALLVLELGGRVHRSTDKGRSFETIEDFVTPRTVAWLTPPADRFVATGGAGFVYADGPRVGTSTTGRSIAESTSTLPGSAHGLACASGECVALGDGARVFGHREAEGWRDRGVVDGTSSVSVAARIGDAIWVGTAERGVFRVTDAGFEPVGRDLPRIDGPAGSQVSPITGLARFRGAVFASTASSGVWRLLDGADAWEPINGGIPIASRDGFGRPRRAGLTALQASEERMATAGEQLFHLDPGSGRWEESSAPSDALAALAASDAGFFATTAATRERPPRVFRSLDGRLYDAVASPSSQPRHVIALGDELWVAGEDGVFRSRDRGERFERVETGLGGVTPAPFATGALALSDDALWLGTRGGVYRRPVSCEVTR